MESKESISMIELVVKGGLRGLESPIYIDDIIERMQERRGPLLSRESIALMELVKEKDNDH